MTAKISGSPKLKRSSLPKFNHDIYPVISSSSLIVYSVHYLIEQEIEVKLEDVVFACFTLFPQKFALKKYPRWPDSALVSRRLSDCRNEGYISVNMDHGFKLTIKGLRLAEKTAKILGASIPRRTAKVLPLQPKEYVAELVKKVEPVISEEKPAPVEIQQVVKPAKIVRKKKTILPAPVKVIETFLPNVEVIVAKSVQKEKIISSASTKKVQSALPIADVIVAKPAQKEKVILSAPTKKIEASLLKVKKESVSIKPVKKAQSVQPVTVPITPVKNIKHPLIKETKPVVSAVQPDKVKPAQLTLFKKTGIPAPDVVSKEVKIRAGKFVHLMERSDAYLHYKKDGKNSKIGEFDFRSLLLCTMESSRETLVKNVELFKGYARIHNRQDLLTFLDYCEDKFSYLLIAPQKQLKRKSTRGREIHG